MSRRDRGDRDRCPRRGRMRGLPLKAFPLGGRWHGEAVTDEGAMIERFFVGPDALIGPLDGSFRGGVSPPAGGEFLCPWRQRNQNATGDSSDERFALIFAFPRPPFTGVIPWARQNPSGAQNQECLSAVPSGPTGGLSGKKIGTAAVPPPRLGLPNQRYRCESWRAHAMRPYWFPVDCRGGYQPPASLPLGEGRFPLSGGNGRRPKGVGRHDRRS